MILSTFSCNDVRRAQCYQYINIFISNHVIGLNHMADHMIGLNHCEVATLQAKLWPHYPFLGVTLYILYNNEYYSLH